MSDLTVSMNKKTNKKFMVLSALGIIMVVDAHCYNCLGLFTGFIPYDSFFMPLFVFISGYFTKIDNNTDLFEYIKKRSKRLLLPYVIITFASFWIGFFINWFKTGSMPLLNFSILPGILYDVLTTGMPVKISSPLWFVLTLFVLQMFYALIKKVFYKHWNSFIAFSVFTVLNIIVVYICRNDYFNDYLLLPYKCLFFLPFIELGIIYRDHLEKRMEKLKGLSSVLILLLLLLLNMIRMMILPEYTDISFVSLSLLEGFTSPFPVTPMISSLIGIFFWLIIVDIIGKGLYENGLVNYISNNTYWIMGLHLIFFNLVNCILLFINNNIHSLTGFDINEFCRYDWYRWEYYRCFKLVYFIAGLFGPLAVKLVWDKIVNVKEKQ